MMILRDIALLGAMIHVFVIVASLFESKYSYRKTPVLLAVGLLPVVLLNAVLYSLLGMEKMGQIVLLTGSLPCMLVFYLLSRQRDARIFFTFFLTNTVVFASVVLSHIIDYYLVGNQMYFFFICQMTIYPLLEWFIWERMRKFYRDLLRTVKHGWGLFAVVSLCFFVLLVMLSSWPVPFYKTTGHVPLLLLVIVTIVLVYLTIFQVLYIQQRNFYAMEDERRRAQREQLLRNELEAERLFVHSAKQYRHDMHHHGKVIYEYLEQNDVEAAKNYLQIYRNHLEEVTLQNYCEHPVVNALLRITERQCQEKNIKFVAEGNVPENLPVTEPEIGSVLGNLLENACEAAARTPRGFVHIHAEERGNVLYVELKNSVAGVVKFDGDIPRSTKTNGGIGIPSIQTVLDKYDGMVSYRQDGKTFLTRLILPL